MAERMRTVRARGRRRRVREVAVIQRCDRLQPRAVLPRSSGASADARRRGRRDAADAVGRAGAMPAQLLELFLCRSNVCQRVRM